MNISIQQVIHAYQSPNGVDVQRVLDIEQWDIHQGSQYWVKGVSGSGKTTFFNIATGMMKPTQGRILYGDVNLYQLREDQRDTFRSRHIGYVFQSHYLLDTLTALENVLMPMKFARRFTHPVRNQRANELLENMGLGKYKHHRPHQLSTGQRMRVAIARAMANMPKVIFADEPTASLDLQTSEQVMGLLVKYCIEHNATLIVASHDPMMKNHFKEVAEIVHGKLVLNAGMVS